MRSLPCGSVAAVRPVVVVGGPPATGNPRGMAGELAALPPPPGSWPGKVLPLKLPRRLEELRCCWECRRGEDGWRVGAGLCWASGLSGGSVLVEEEEELELDIARFAVEENAEDVARGEVEGGRELRSGAIGSLIGWCCSLFV